jgi:hypothetical protein
MCGLPGMPPGGAVRRKLRHMRRKNMRMWDGLNL